MAINKEMKTCAKKKQTVFFSFLTCSLLLTYKKKKINFSAIKTNVLRDNNGYIIVWIKWNIPLFHIYSTETVFKLQIQQKTDNRRFQHI